MPTHTRLHDGGVTGDGTQTLTTDETLAPAGNSLVTVIYFGGRGGINFTSTFSTVGGWTVEILSDFVQSQFIIAIGRAVTTASPGTGTVSVNHPSQNFFGGNLWVDQFTGVDTSTPVGAIINTVTSTSDDTSPSGTFSPAPAANSLLYGAIGVRKTSGSVDILNLAPASGLTRIGTTLNEWQNIIDAAIADGSNGAEFGWTIDSGTSGRGIVALEVLSSSAPAGPEITTQPTSQEVTAPASATFTGAATGEGTINYQWRYREGSEGTPANVDFGTADPVTGATTGFNTGVNTTSRSGWQFQFVATDDNGSTESDWATLTVEAAVDPEHPFTSVTVTG